MEMTDLQNEMLETIIDWFETIEEIELKESEKIKLQVVADLLASFKQESVTQGIPEESFEDWLQIDLLDCWSSLIEDVEENIDPVQTFYDFVMEGQERLYFQMMKYCMAIAESA